MHLFAGDSLSNQSVPHDLMLEARAEIIKSTASVRRQDMVSHLMTQIDVTMDAFILSSLIELAVGVSLVMYRRQKGSVSVSTAFRLTKMSFVVVFVVAVTIFDMPSVLRRETDFARLFKGSWRSGAGSTGTDIAKTVIPSSVTNNRTQWNGLQLISTLCSCSY